MATQPEGRKDTCTDELSGTKDTSTHELAVGYVHKCLLCNFNNIIVFKSLS